MVYLYNEKVKNLVKARKKLKLLKSGKVEHQTGSSDFERDAKRKALPTGYRISKNGNIYYEYRKNRSDKKGSKL